MEKMEKAKSFIFIVIALLVGVYLGSWMQQSSSDKDMIKHEGMHDDTHMEMDHSHHDHHTHDMKEFSGDPDKIPFVDLTIHEDPKSGWNAEIYLENFVFSPENASKKDVMGEGHAHIYVNGEKINRIYGNWYHIQELPKGQNMITVKLSTNDHGEIVFDGESISDTEVVNVE